MSANNSSGVFGEIGNQAGVVVNTQQDISDIKARTNVIPQNAFIFPSAAATLDNATTRIDINDLVFTVGCGKSARRGVLNNAIPVSSNCNGLFIYKTKTTAKVWTQAVDDIDEYNEEVRQVLSETIRLIGQALGATVPIPEREELLKLNFTTRVAGTAHIINTGDQTIVPGETVCWDLFSTKDVSPTDNNGGQHRFARYGYGIRKVPLKLVKLSHAWKSYEWALKREIGKRALGSEDNKRQRLKTSSGVFANAVLDFVKDIAFISDVSRIDPADLTEDRMDANRLWDGVNVGQYGQLQTETLSNKLKQKLKQKAVSDLVAGIMYMVNDLDRRKVGTALSYSKPGKGLDINLQI
jgi:hypothetical protein